MPCPDFSCEEKGGIVLRRMKLLMIVLMAVLAFVFTGGEVKAAEKQTIYNSPYVTFTPDGKAWTTNAGDTNIKTYPYGETVTTGISSSLRELNEGEHYYPKEVDGEVPIGKWVVKWPKGMCIHSQYPSNGYHGIDFGTQFCRTNYFSGWIAYCADCNEPVGGMHVYMSKEAAESIDYLEAKPRECWGDMDYYYLCPFCYNLEQGASFVHECQDISYNQYQVVYDQNHRDVNGASGFMSASYHIYNNAIEYNGEKITPVTHLTINNYKRRGYEFVEWNTKPDGSGESFLDGAEISNLSSADCNMPDTWTSDDNGTVVLYAQWRKSESTLQIMPNGGKYLNSSISTVITREYGTSYTADVADVECPKGYVVTYQTNGGEATDYRGNVISSVTGTTHFTGWSKGTSFKGQLKDNTYIFIAPDGHTDYIYANFAPSSIVLPKCKKDGYSFGGWYYDSAFKKPAGDAGDRITPTQNMTLYAQWVELILYSQDNYSANDGKGAVDLAWSQDDGNDKAYKVYQSTDASTWKQVTSATDIGTSLNVNETFDYSGESYEYTVPYTGIYNVHVYGAQGGNYESHSGGKGGYVNGAAFLDAGEKLTITPGGQDGFNGGGDGEPYGNGGGATTVVSDKKGTLFIAGGGGGATTKTAGGEGGAQTSLRVDGKPEGEDGGAGGGAGYVGGTAGDYEVHNCVPECSGLNPAQQGFYDVGQGVTIGDDGVYGDGIYGARFTPKANGFGASATGKNYTTQWAGMSYFVGSSQEYLSTPKTGELSFHYDTNLTGEYRYVDIKITVYDKDTGNVVYSFNPLDASYTESSETEHLCDNGASCWMGQHKRANTIWTYTDPEVTGQREYYPFTTWNNHDGSYKGVSGRELISLDFTIPIPESVKGVYLGATVSIYGKVATSTYTTHMYSGISDVSYTFASCGYEDGEVISTTPAYGGSSYVAEEWMNSFSSEQGKRNGDGKVELRASNVGYLKEQQLAGVSAPDLAAPDTVGESTVTRTPLGSDRVVISWTAPADNGTDYYHRVTSHLRSSSSVLCTSNITLNILKTGIKGYYYIVDSQADTVMADTPGTGENFSFTKQPKVTVSVTEETQYLHVAAVDKAGNIGGTIHVKIQADAGGNGVDILWNLATGPITVEDTGNIHPAGTDKWYVKADGSTPFTLMYDAYLEGTASISYQPNYSIFRSRYEDISGENILFTQNHAISDDSIVTTAQNLIYTTKDNPILGQYPYMVTERSNRNRDLRTTQKFTLNSECHGKEIAVYPGTGAAYGEDVVYSDETADKLHTVILIGDGEAPEITGMDNIDGEGVLEIRAADALSGLRDLYVEVLNIDNFDRITYYPEADSVVRIDLSAAMFDGDLQVRAVAVDNVGNETEMIASVTEFAMSAVIERMLFPHDPVFQCGESGILTITTYGYADRIVVEFPAGLETGQSFSREFSYTTPAYMTEEKIQFMVPLNARDGGYVVKVTAYKNGREMGQNEPELVVKGTVLQELRTRLR